MKAHLVGGGLASLAAAAYLIRIGGALANNIHIYEAQEQLGGTMGMSGGPDIGYVLPTGRVFEMEYRCALDLYSAVPSASDPEQSIQDEILAFNKRHGYHDNAHVIDRERRIVSSEHFGLSARDRLDLIRLALTPEHALEGRRIDEYLGPSFFETEFWYLWAPLMGSLPQHSAIEMRRYLLRFLHLLPDLSTMTKVLRTRFNQYEAIVEPMAKWLKQQGVNFYKGAEVTTVEFEPSREHITANALDYVQDGKEVTVEVVPNDIVLVTNGSQVADLAVGSMSDAPQVSLKGHAWSLWNRLAKKRAEFGRPEVFFGADKVPDTKWTTFTVTSTGSEFFERMTAFTGSEPGRGGLMTFRDSAWFLTLAIFHQPEFVDQPSDRFVWWGFGITPDRTGDFIKKPMSACNGAEILEETIHHLGFESDLDSILTKSTCIPCTLPYGGSVWMPRNSGDRPSVVPPGSTNFGFIGQFAEQPKDTIFTMEYSVRSAWHAVATLLKSDHKPPPVYQGQEDPKALYEALRLLA